MSKRRIAKLEQLCGELYQIIGALAGHRGCFDHPEVQRALDAASEAKLDTSLLPWPASPLTRRPKLRDRLKKAR